MHRVCLGTCHTRTHTHTRQLYDARAHHSIIQQEYNVNVTPLKLCSIPRINKPIST